VPSSEKLKAIVAVPPGLNNETNLQRGKISPLFGRVKWFDRPELLADAAAPTAHSDRPAFLWPNTDSP
jgi:hypothetical protein